MSLWQRQLKRLEAIAEHRTYRFRLNSLKGFVSLFLVGTVLSVALAACSGGGTGNTSSSETPNASATPVAANKDNVELTLVSFAVTKAAHEAIIPKFVEQWKKDHNQTVMAVLVLKLAPLSMVWKQMLFTWH